MNNDGTFTTVNPTHRARKRFGQNFLQDESVIDQIVRAVSLRADDRLVEIGPGRGALTRPLLAALGAAGHLTLLELDRDLAALLETALANTANTTLLQTDALNFDFAQLALPTTTSAADVASDDSSSEASDTGTNKPLRVIGNLPYNISTPLLFHLLQQHQDFQRAKGAPLFRDMHFMLQQEVVQRICAQPGSKQFGRLSVMTQYFCATEALFTVPPTAFVPVPKVHSAIVRLTPHLVIDPVANSADTLALVVKTAFAQRRKTLRNNLRGLLDETVLRELGIDPGARAETLAVADFVAISNAIGTS